MSDLGLGGVLNSTNNQNIIFNNVQIVNNLSINEAPQNLILGHHQSLPNQKLNETNENIGAASISNIKLVNFQPSNSLLNQDNFKNQIREIPTSSVQILTHTGSLLNNLPLNQNLSGISNPTNEINNSTQYQTIHVNNLTNLQGINLPGTPRKNDSYNTNNVSQQYSNFVTTNSVTNPRVGQTNFTNLDNLPNLSNFSQLSNTVYPSVTVASRVPVQSSQIGTGSNILPATKPKAHRPTRKKGETKKCRKVYSIHRKDEWCKACIWKKACTRFPD